MTLKSGTVVSLSGFRITCSSTHCDVECLKCRYNLTEEESEELEQRLIDMFKFLTE